MKRLMQLVAIGSAGEAIANSDSRGPSPQWVDLERGIGTASRHVLINCPQCLRPFRQSVHAVDAVIRETECVYCGGHVSYAIALAINPASMPGPRPEHTTSFACEAA